MDSTGKVISPFFDRNWDLDPNQYLIDSIQNQFRGIDISLNNWPILSLFLDCFPIPYSVKWKDLLIPDGTILILSPKIENRLIVNPDIEECLKKSTNKGGGMSKCSLIHYTSEEKVKAHLKNTYFLRPTIIKKASGNSVFIFNQDCSLLKHKLSEIPEISELNIWYSNLSEFDLTLKDPNRLNILRLCHNSLIKIPENLLSYPNLQILDVSFNKISQLDESVLKLTELQELWLDSNPLSLPNEFIDKIIETESFHVCSITNIWNYKDIKKKAYNSHGKGKIKFWELPFSAFFNQRKKFLKN